MGILAPNTKQCYQCMEIKPRTEFSIRSTGKINSYCRQCYNTIQQTWRSNNRASARAIWQKSHSRIVEGGMMAQQAQHLKYAYAMTPEEFNELYEVQKGCCACCGNLFGPRKNKTTINVDHDPVTNKVRGLLCHSCNRGLGCFKENIENLRLAVKYLEKYSGG